MFTALDNRLDTPRLRKIVRSPEEAGEMLGKLGMARIMGATENSRKGELGV